MLWFSILIRFVHMLVGQVVWYLLRAQKVTGSILELALIYLRCSACPCLRVVMMRLWLCGRAHASEANSWEIAGSNLAHFFPSSFLSPFIINRKSVRIPQGGASQLFIRWKKRKSSCAAWGNNKLKIRNLIFGNWNIWEPWAVWKFLEKHLNWCKTLKRNIKYLWVWIKSENKVSSAFGVALRSGPILWFKPAIQLFHRGWALMSHDLHKMLTTSTSVGKIF